MHRGDHHIFSQHHVLKFQEIGEDKIELIKTILVQRLPKSCRMLNIFTLTFMEPIRMPKRCVTKFYAFDNDLSLESQSSSLLLSVQHLENSNGGYYIMISQPEPDTIRAEMLEALEVHLKWECLLRVEIDACGPLMSFFQDMLAKRRKFGKLNSLKTYDCLAFAIMDSSILDKNELLIESNSSATVVVKPLESAEDISTLNASWSQQTSGTSLDFITTAVKNLPSGGVFVNGELVSWGFTSVYGSLNGLGTNLNHRRRGYAKLVTNFIAEEQVKIGLIPTTRTLTSNIEAQKVMDDVGYVKSHESRWLIYSET